MDAVLKQALKLACLIQDSKEARSWRKAWNSLAGIEFISPNLMSLPAGEVPLVDVVLAYRHSDAGQCRPLLFPMLIMFDADAVRIKTELRQHPQVWRAYRRLVDCSVLTGQLVTFLRRIGPGYPHQDLIYTIPNTPWTRLSSARELPWRLGESLLVRNSSDARHIGLERSVPSVSRQVADSLNALAEAVRASDIWLELENAFRTVTRRKSLIQEIHRAKVQFEKEFRNISTRNIPPSVLWARVEELAKKVYSKRGSRIQAYVKAFWEYEGLIERIYWIISQLVIYETISCLTTSMPEQLQQVSLSYGKDAPLTALAQTRAKTLQIGQLVHVELVEMDQTLDGLYQVEQWYETYQVGTIPRALFHARCLWYCELKALLDATEDITNQVFVPSEAENMWGEGGRIDIVGPEGIVDSLPIGEVVPSLELRKTIYLP